MNEQKQAMGSVVVAIKRHSVLDCLSSLSSPYLGRQNNYANNL